MNPLKLIRKFGKLIRGGASSKQVFFSCLLGVLIGMTPGVNMTLVIGVLLFVILNANFGLLLVGLMVGKALCYALAPVTFEIGALLIHGVGLEGLFRTISQTPVLALMNLHYYCLVGGLPVAIVVGSALGIAVGRTIGAIRGAVVAGSDKNDRFRKLSQNRLVRLLLRIVFGKQRKTMAEMLAETHPTFRKSGVVFCAVVVALLVVFELAFADSLARWSIKSGIEAAVGAEVNVTDVDVSLFGGRVSIGGLQITDRDKPTHNLVEVEKLTTDVGIVDLLARRFVIDELVIDAVRTGTKRERPGYVLVAPTKVEPPKTDTAVSEYFEKGEELLAKLAKLKDYLDKRKSGQDKEDPAVEPPPPVEEARELARRQGYLRASAQSVLARRPTVTIRKLRVSGISVGQRDIYAVAGADVCDKPELSDQPMLLNLSSTGGAKGELRLDYTTPQSKNHLRLFLPNLSAAGMMNDRVPLNLSSAKVDVWADGVFDNETIDLPIELTIRGSAMHEGKGMLGLDPAIATKMLSAIGDWKVPLKLVGPTNAPNVQLDEKKMLANLAGNAGGLIKKGVGGIIKGGRSSLGGLLGGDKKDPKKKDDKDDKKDKSGGLLDIFK